MKKTRYTENQIVKALKEVEGGRNIKDLCRELEISGRDLLQLAVQVRRYGGLRRQEDEGS